MNVAPRIRLTNAAWLVVQNYFLSHPTERIREAQVHYIDPLTNPDDFFCSELGEPNHKALLLLVRTNRSVMDQNHAYRWIMEEEVEENEK